MWLRIDTSLGSLVIQWFTGVKGHPYFVYLLLSYLL